MNGYAEVRTRGRIDGAIDKAVLVEAMAADVAHDREFAEFVLRTISDVGSAADAQAARWCAYVESLPYRREHNEVLRDPRETVGAGGRPASGGDCDDLVLAVLAGLRSLAIPCQAELMAGEDGWAFHIRARVGLPPLNPQTWIVVDPVWRSEREWAMAERDPQNNALAQSWHWLAPQSLRGSEGQTSSTPRSWSLLLSLGSLLGGWVLFRKWSKGRS